MFHESSTTSAHVSEPIPSFGGQHTSEKLEIVNRYLTAYRKVMGKQNFEIIYIDAFAGAGYYRPPGPAEKQEEQLIFEPFRDESVSRLFEGSARRSLAIDPPFDRYVFIERNPHYAQELQSLKDEFSGMAQRIIIRQTDANEYLQSLATKNIWQSRRAVVFLDPFGMEVKWKTVENLAQTEAIDMWYLFPVGLGVGRLLRNDGHITPQNQAHLDDVFGTPEWRARFYAASNQETLFSTDADIEKIAKYTDIERFVVERLQSVFRGVAERPYRLFNSRGAWLYSMFFAAGNPKGAKIALRIANHILQERPWQRVQASSGLK